MARIPDRFIDDLLARVDIVEVIESRVPLKRAGRDHMARCPFHDERSASFSVSPTKQFYHCFGCGAHGSAIKFLMEYDRLEFVDAVEDLAARVGMTVPYEGGAVRGPQDQFAELYEVLDASARFFQKQLPGSEKCGKYLEKRGLDAAMIQRFGIGYAPDSWDAIKHAVGSSEGRLKALDAAGMLSTGDRGGAYDKFRDRLMFPIHDRRGRVIAFGGRVMGDADGPKYLNSPETPLFHKGRELYALHQVRQSHSKIPRLIVVEGYLDVIALFQFGITQAVATLGTATTKDHAELLFRNSADVYFCFDGDKAGRSAAWRAVESVLPRMKDGRQALFLFLPEGEDPDSLIRKEGATGFEARLKDAMPLSEFFFADLGKDIDLRGLEGKARLAERAKPLLAQIPDGAFRDLMQQSLATRTGMQRVAPVAPTTQTYAPATVGKPPQRSLVRAAVALLMQKPEIANALEPPYLFGTLRQPGIPLLMELIAMCRTRPDMNTATLLQQFEGRDDYEALAKLAQVDFPSAPEHWRTEFVDACEQLNRQTLQQRIDELLGKQDSGFPLSAAEKTELREALAAKGRR
ncbi:MAG: DNA primase [Xanthomonadales bacterium]|nr:DNA primase [Xanthomonadales bacterium]MCC6560876.1 DNA primase [Xanthomonadales bacterium]